MDFQGADFTFDANVDFSNMFATPQTSKPADNTSGFSFADEGIDTATSFIDPTVFDTPQQSVFNMQHSLVRTPPLAAASLQHPMRHKSTHANDGDRPWITPRKACRHGICNSHHYIPRIPSRLHQRSRSTFTSNPLHWASDRCHSTFKTTYLKRSVSLTSISLCSHPFLRQHQLLARAGQSNRSELSLRLRSLRRWVFPTKRPTSVRLGSTSTMCCLGKFGREGLQTTFSVINRKQRQAY
jgi:hypothetical protein